MIHITLLLTAATFSGADWPTFRGDAARTGASKGDLAFPLTEEWVHTSSGRPQNAWPGPARHDLYSKVMNLTPRLWFDRAFYVSIADGRIFFGSSADEQIHCLDAATGEELWSYYTEAPVRFTPTIVGGKVIAGSDDGVVYCLRASNGELVWKERVAPDDQRLPGNGRMISMWPIRTGAVVSNGVAYVTAGLFPSESSYVAALKVSSGDTVWKNNYKDMAPQGYLLASKDHLFVPASRSTPYVFDRRDGKRLRQLGGNSGTFAIVANDDLVFGPGKTGDMTEASGGGAQIASFKGQHMIVTRGVSYIHTTTELSALKREEFVSLTKERGQLNARRGQLSGSIPNLSGADKTKAERELARSGERLGKIEVEIRECILWRRVCDEPLDVILAGDALIAGGEDHITAYAAEDGAKLWTAPVDGRAYGLATDDGRLYVSTDTGAIHCFGNPSQEEAGK